MRRTLFSVSFAMMALAPFGSSFAVGEPPILLGPRVTLQPRPASVQPTPTPEGLKPDFAASSPSEPGADAKPAAGQGQADKTPNESAAQPAQASTPTQTPSEMPSTAGKPPSATPAGAQGGGSVSETAAAASFAAAPGKQAAAAAAPVPASSNPAVAAALPMAAPPALDPDERAYKPRRLRGRQPEPVLGAQGFAYAPKAQPAKPLKASYETVEDFREDCGWSRGALTGTGPFGVCVLN